MDVVGISADEQVLLGNSFVCRSFKTCQYISLINFWFLKQDAIFRVVASILHLGNIEFAKGKEIDSSVPKDEKSWFHLRTAAELLM